jgi:hypothetical protein
MDPVRELPYRLAAIIAASEAGQMAASDHVHTPQNIACAEGGVHRWKADVRCANLSAMRLVFLVPAVVVCAACAERPPINVRAVGEGYTCALTANGAVVSTDAELRALARASGKRALLDTNRSTPYRCLGGTIVRLQQAGFKVVGVTADGVPIPSR